MSTLLVDSLIAAGRASRRTAFALAAVASSWALLGGVAHARGWSGHQVQLVSPVRASGGPSHAIQSRSTPMGLHFAPVDARARIGPARAHASVPFRTGWVRTPAVSTPARFALLAHPGLGVPGPLREHASAHPSLAASPRHAGRWSAGADAHPVPTRALEANAPLARVVREQHIPVLEALLRQRHGRR
jgi:hypothetical protein